MKNKVKEHIFATIDKSDLEELSNILQNYTGLNSITNDDGQTPMVMAAWNGNEAVCRILIDHGANIDSKDLQSGETGLMLASLEGDYGMAEFLLDNGADIEATDNQGGTALMHAAISGEIEMTKLLLDRGANLDVIDIHGKSAIDWANRINHTFMSEFIEEYRAHNQQRITI